MKAFLPLLLFALPSLGIVVDRVAVSAGNLVITTSEIEERIRLTALQNGAPADFRPAALKEAAERLIDQKLVAKEMLVGRYASMTDKESEPLVAQFIKDHYPNDQEFQKALQKYGLTSIQLQRDLARQADLLAFLNLRFRPAVQVTDEDIRNYYRDNVETKNSPVKAPALDDVRAAIEETLTNERADKELDAWLKDQRKRLKIEYHPEAFGATE